MSYPKYSLRIIVFMSFFFFSVIPVFSDSIFLNDSDKEIPIGLSLEILEDPTGELSLKDVISEKYSAKFRGSKKKVPHFGYTDSAIWVRFNLNAKNTQKDKWYLELAIPPVYDFKLYSSQDRHSWGLVEVGSQKRFRERPIQFRNFVFPLYLEGVHYFYGRMKTGGSAFLPLTIWEPTRFIEKVQREQLFLGVFFGIILAMVIYNLFLYFATRDKNYILYVLYVSSFGLAMFSDRGLSLEYFWAEIPRFNTFAELFFYNSAVVWGLTFVRNFLETKKNAALLNKILFGLTIPACLVLPLYLLGFPSQGIQLNLFISPVAAIFCLIAGVFIYIRGYKQARYFVLAFFALLLLGIPIYALKLYGIFESNLFTDNAILLSSIFEVVLLSLALADRITTLREEREDALLKQKETQLILNRTQLDRLKRVIQPHYLLNSIHAISGWMLKDPQKAMETVESLSDEFRNILDFSDKKLISVAEEIALCKSHLKVMSARKMRDYRLITENLIDSEHIPPLIFHTVIENGIKHETAGDDAITFHIQREQGAGSVSYSILSRGNFAKSKNIREGTGVRYIRMRLEEAYPGRWRFEQRAVPDGWQTVIKIESNFKPM